MRFTNLFKRVGSLLLLTAALTVVGCTEDQETPNPDQTPDETPNPEPEPEPEPEPAPALKFEWTNAPEEGQPLFVVPDSKVELTYTAENVTSVEAGELPAGWSVEVFGEESRIEISATADAAALATLTVTATGDSEEQEPIEQSVELYCLNHFDDPLGAFVLNEGNMTTENGSLTYITPEGYVIDDAYKLVNGTELGNVAQDMAICDGKIYVISQNGNQNAVGSSFENDGMLVVMDARTLRKTASFTNDDLSALDWPSHIAVLDEQHIYIRDNAGVYRLDATTKALTLVSGSEGAPKSRFVTMNGKVYTYKSGLLSKILEISPESDAVKSYSLPFRVTYDINEIRGIQGSDDGKIWIMSFGFGEAAIGKYDLETNTIVQHLIGVDITAGSAGVAFVARGNDLYYADGMTIYHLAFDDEAADEQTPDGDPVSSEEWMVDVSALDSNAGLSYNGLGVHPVTGRVYINTIKSYALYTENQIWGFDFSSSLDTPAEKYENYTNFPAGFFFPEAR